MENTDDKDHTALSCLVGQEILAALNINSDQVSALTIEIRADEPVKVIVERLVTKRDVGLLGCLFKRWHLVPEKEFHYLDSLKQWAETKTQTWELPNGDKITAISRRLD